jgi:DNA modification methylase
LPWSHYYAGYSEAFAKNAILRTILPNSQAIILDPWNGSGTTTVAASKLGFRSVGIDVNPVMQFVAKSRLIHAGDIDLVRSAIDVMEHDSTGARCGANESTTHEIPWFNDESSIWVKTVARQILNVPNILGGDRMDIVASFLLLALATSLRRHLSPFYSSNPNWIKVPKRPTEQLSISNETLQSEFLNVLFDFQNRLLEVPAWDCQCSLPHISTGQAESIPTDDRTIDAVITSPPYLTRLDYAIATLPELSLIGLASNDKLSALRNRMLGTTTIHRANVREANATIGPSGLEVLRRIENHHSKASSTYYIKSVRQYFDSLDRSINEIQRVIKSNGKVIMVVQDSYYKDVLIPLPSIVQEMFLNAGLTLSERHDFPVRSNMRSVNSKSRSYSESKRAVESVLVFHAIDTN